MYCSYNSTTCKDTGDYMNIKIFSDDSSSKTIKSQLAFDETHTYDNIEYYRNWIKIDKKFNSSLQI